MIEEIQIKLKMTLRWYFWPVFYILATPYFFIGLISNRAAEKYLIWVGSFAVEYCADVEVVDHEH